VAAPEVERRHEGVEQRGGFGDLAIAATRRYMVERTEAIRDPVVDTLGHRQSPGQAEGEAPQATSREPAERLAGSGRAAVPDAASTR